MKKNEFTILKLFCKKEIYNSPFCIISKKIREQYNKNKFKPI